MLLDTSGLLCLAHRDEPGHAAALHLLKAASRKLTHNYVLAEFVALARVRGLPREPVLTFAARMLDNPEIEVHWVGEPLHRRGVAFLQDRLDKTYSLCDAVSFLLMRELGIREALTTDHHFEQEGFRQLLR
jgi:predicted nucleic acid-binding protein